MSFNLKKLIIFLSIPAVVLLVVFGAWAVFSGGILEQSGEKNITLTEVRQGQIASDIKEEEKINPLEIMEELKIEKIKSNKPDNSDVFAIKSLAGDVMEIGEERHSPSQPYLKLNKWDGEVFLKINVPYGSGGQKQLNGNKLRWTNDDYHIDFYPKEPEEITEIDSKGKEHKFTINEEGGVEFDVILKEKSETNIFEFPIEANGLEFYYQPPLNQEKQEEGIECAETACWNEDGKVVSFRPENVVGSYAVYHESKSGDYTKMGGKNYKAGVAFHIYRPKIADAEGNEIWGELDVNKESGVLSVIVDSSWLDKAVYPVTIDPNFGYETAGGTSYSISSSLAGSLFTGAAGTVDSLTAYVHVDTAAGEANIDYGVYKHSDSSYVCQSATYSMGPDGYFQNWKTLAVSGSPSISAVEYVLAMRGTGDSEYTIGLYYNAGATNQGHYQAIGTWPNPAVFSHNTNKYSIYATYTLPPPTISGIVYTDEGSTPYNCSTDNLTIGVSVNGGATATGTCTLATGVFSITAANFPSAAGDPVVVFIDSVESPKGTTVTLAADTTSNISLPIYQNRVIVRHENAGPMTNAKMTTGDNGNAGIRYLIFAGALLVESGMELHIWTGDTFTPGDMIETSGAGGNLHLDDSASLNFTSTASISGGVTIDTGAILSVSSIFNVAGNWTNNGTFTHNSSTVSFNGSAAQAISGSSTTTFNNLTVTNTTAAVSSSVNFNIAGTMNMNGANTLFTPAAVAVINNAGAAGAITGSGKVQVTRTAATPDYSSQYKFTTNTLTNLTVEYTAASAQTVSAVSYGHLKISTTASAAATLAAATAVSGNLTISSGGTLSTGADYALNVGGNWTKSGTFTANSGTVTFNGAAAQTISGATTWNNLTINNTYAAPDDTYDVDPGAVQTVAGTLTVTDGQWTPYTGDTYGNVSIAAAGIMKPDASASISVSGNYSNSGTFTHNSGTVTFNATAGGKTLSGTMTSPSNFNNLTFNGIGGGWTFGANSATVANNFTITAGAVTAPSTTLTVGGNYSNSGTFTHNSGTVTFNDTAKNSAISGTTTFYNLTSTTPSKAITFAAGSTQTIASGGALTLDGGACGTKIILRSSSTPTKWNINIISGASTSVSYANIKDSNASGAAITANDAVDSGGNAGWTISAGPNCYFAYDNPASKPTGAVLDFDGINDYLAASDDPILDQPNALSFSVWINPRNSSIGDEYIIYRQDAYYIKKNASDFIVGAIWYSSAWHTVIPSRIASNSLIWMHIELTYDKDAGGTNQLKLYFNGILDGAADNSTAIPAAATKLYIGAGDEVGKDNTPENFFDGKIGDLKFYQYARSADEVRVDYNYGKAAHLGKDSQRDDGLVGFWNMEEGTGQTVYDRSGNGNSGTLGTDTSVGKDDPVFTRGYSSSGPGGTGLKFDGVDDYVDAGNAASLSNTQGTISMWFKAQTQTTGTLYDVYVDDGNLVTIFIGDVTGDYSDESIKLYKAVSSTAVYNINIRKGHTFYQDNQWHQLVFTMGSNFNKVYVDGLEQTLTYDVGNSSTGNIFSNFSTSPQQRIAARRYTGSLLPFSGSIDEVRIYNRALSADEIRQHYNQKKPVLEMKFDEGSGTVARDESFNNNDGTLYSGATVCSNPPTAGCPTWTTGKFGSAISFDGTDDYVQATVSQGTTTVSLWVQNNSVWEHVAKIGSVYYVNGIAGATPVSYPVYISGSTVQIGKSGVSTFVKALVDEVRIYNYARTPAEILVDYNDGKAAHLGKDSQRDDGLVGYWNMEEGTGQTVYDRSGNGNNGTLGASTSVGKDDPVFTSGYSSSGPGGTGLKFDGVNDYVNIPHSSILSITGDMTLEAWIYSNRTNAINFIVGKDQPLADSSKPYGLYQTNLGKAAFVLGSDSANPTVKGSTTINANQWYHFVGTISGTSMKIYLNGVSDAVPVTFSGGRQSNALPVFIGQWKDGSSYFSGTIDEVRIYNRALSADEIRQHYNQKKPVLEMKFDEGSGTIAHDESFNNNDGTLVNTPTWLQGKFGSALNFTKTSSQYGYLADNASISLTKDLTISAWVKPSSITAATLFDIAGKWDGANESYLLAQYGDEIRMYIDSSSNYKTTDNANLATGSWYHIEGVYNAAAQTVNIYVSGILQTGTVTGTIPASIGDDTGRFHIAAEDSTGGAANFYDGAIDEVKVYSYARTPAEILVDYNNGLAARLR